MALPHGTCKVPRPSVQATGSLPLQRVKLCHYPQLLLLC